MTGHCLVVANQTLGGDALDDAVKACMARGLLHFYVIVPMTHVEHEASGWTGGFGMSEGASPEVVREAMEESARQREADREEPGRGCRGRGEIRGAAGRGRSHPRTGLVLRRDHHLHTTAGISRWLKMDLPNRVSRMTDVPVTTIEADS